MTVGELRKALDAFPDDYPCSIIEQVRPDNRGLYKRVTGVFKTMLVGWPVKDGQRSERPAVIIS